MQPAAAPLTTSCNRRAASSTEGGLPFWRAVQAPRRIAGEDRLLAGNPSMRSAAALPSFRGTTPLSSRAKRSNLHPWGPGDFFGAFPLVVAMAARLVMTWHLVH